MDLTRVQTIAGVDARLVDIRHRDDHTESRNIVDNGLLTFTSAVRSPWKENNTVYGRFFPAKTTGPAVIVQMDATTAVPPGWRGAVDPFGNLVLESGPP